MAVLDILNTVVESAGVQVSVAYSFANMRDEFRKWLVDGNTREYASEVVLSCIDRISEYAARKVLSSGSLWLHSDYNAFYSDYRRLVKARLLRITDRNTHKMFIVAGQLYLRFLKENPVVCKEAVAATDAKEKRAEPPVVADIIVREDISSDTVVAWLITQPNANGTLYLEDVVRTYMSALRNAPQKLVLDDSQSRNVFSCHTVAEFDGLWSSFKAAPNYVDINKVLWRGQFSAGLAVFRHYLERFENNDDGVLDQTTQAHSRPIHFTSLVPQKSAFDSAVVEQLTDVLSSHFSNGYRLNSPIEMMRFRSFAAEDLGKKLTLSDEELKTHIAACGTNYEGKVYAVSSEAKERIKGLVEEYFDNGAQTIFFAEFYAKNENWLFGASVVSEDMLIDILRRLFPTLSFTQTYFGYTSVSVFTALENEILRVWDRDVLLTYVQLAERLPYIPIERIKYALSQNGDFIWNSSETFTHISRVVITDDEQAAIRAATARACNVSGYVSVTVLPVGEIAERNYELSAAAVHNAIYRICLSDKFDKKGKIVTRQGDVFDALTIIKEYCRTVDKCSLADLLNYERELTGEVHQRAPMEAGNTVLVRIDKNTYVADRYVHFHSDMIDEAIELAVKGDYRPLQSFTTFAAFPDCGQIWNLFLLESYCRRFSQKFRFDTPSVNSRNAGAIIRKGCTMDYIEIMADAAANANIILTHAAVNDFLYKSGYIGRSVTAKVDKVIDNAKAIRGG
jgi:hypothetical protein